MSTQDQYRFTDKPTLAELLATLTSRFTQLYLKGWEQKALNLLKIEIRAIEMEINTRKK